MVVRNPSRDLSRQLVWKVGLAGKHTSTARYSSPLQYNVNPAALPRQADWNAAAHRHWRTNKVPDRLLCRWGPPVNDYTLNHFDKYKQQHVDYVVR